MIIIELSRHRWLQFRRHPFFGQGLFSGILSTLGLLNAAVVLVAVGYFMDDILRKTMPGQNPVPVIHTAVFGLLWLDWLLRPIGKIIFPITLDFYLTLPIPKKRLADFMLRYTLLLKPVNVFLMLMVITWTTKIVMSHYTITHTLLYLLNVYNLILLNTLYGILWKTFRNGAMLGTFFGFTISGLIWLAYRIGMLDYKSLINRASILFLQDPFLVCLICWVFLAGMYAWSLQRLPKTMYMDEQP